MVPQCDDEQGNYQPDVSMDVCPSCGLYYMLSWRYPAPPDWMDDEQAEEFDEQAMPHLECGVCGRIEE